MPSKDIHYRNHIKAKHVIGSCVLQVGRMLQTSLVKGHRQKCGYAALADVNTGWLWLHAV